MRFEETDFEMIKTYGEIMNSKRKNKKLPSRTLNIWNSYDFKMSGLGAKSKIRGKIRHVGNCLKWSKQRIARGYADCDTWSVDGYLQKLLPNMLQHLKDNRHGSPGFLGENYTNQDGILVNDTCHAEWDKILDRMIFLWRESDVETCAKKNPYEKKYRKAAFEFRRKYGTFGQKLQTQKDLENNRKHGGFYTLHTMDELPEYKEIFDKYHSAERKLEKYRSDCKDKAFDMMKEYFYSLWD